ncbi:MAG: curli-like amyloid fiber formation chaperone CsgH [Paracoccaceae bacterium]
MTKRNTRKPDGPTVRLLAAGADRRQRLCGADPGPETGGRTPAPAALAASATHAGEVDCGIATVSHFGLVTFRPWVRLNPGQPGSYSFALSGGGTVVDQGGPIDPGPGGQTLLGEATVTRPVSAYDAELTVTVDGTSFSCRADMEDI